jgi:hypothetical protein
MLAAGAVHASNWISFGNARSGGEVFFSTDIQGKGSIKRVWSKVVFTPNTEKGNDDKWIGSAIVLNAFNCENETSRDEATTIYYQDGTGCPPASLESRPARHGVA